MTDETKRLLSIGEQDRCLNCGAARDAIYCGQCGQRFIDARLSFRGILREIPAMFLALDSGFLATAVGLWKGPGAVARSYVFGERKRWTNPFAFFLIAASLQLIALAFMAPTLKATITSNVAESRAQGTADSDPFEPMDRLLGGKAEEKMADLYMATMRQGYTYAAFLFFCVPFAVFLRLLHRGDNLPYRLAEHLVFALYTVSQLLVCTAVSNLIVFPLNQNLQMAAAMTLYFVYAVVAHRGFYPRGAGSLLRSMVAFVAAVAVFVVSLIGIFTVTLIVRLLLAKMAGA